MNWFSNIPSHGLFLKDLGVCVSPILVCRMAVVSDTTAITFLNLNFGEFRVIFNYYG